jgi:ABC-type transport system involved in cytochrome bd biosynthesis fused ATPase/permease subunit
MFYASVGLVIVSIALGYRYDDITGWLVFGAGVIVLSLLNELFDYLRDRNLTREDAE